MWRLTPKEARQTAEEIKAITGKPNSDGVPNFLRLLAKSPAATKAFVQAEAALGNGELTPHQREQIALLVAEINGSKYCLALHERNAREAGLGDSEIQLSRKASSDDPKNQAMLCFVQAIVLQRGEVSNDDFSAMRNAGFSESEIIEVLANVVLSIFRNYFNILAQTDPDLAAPADQKAGRAPKIVSGKTL